LIHGRPCYYVGKTTDPETRLADHTTMGPRCAAWVRRHGGVAEIEEPITPREELASWEQKETIAQIMRHGFDRVRGWEWTGCGPFDDYAGFRTCAIGNGDLCRRCGAAGHFAKGCTADPLPWLQRCNAAAPAAAPAPAAPAAGTTSTDSRCARCGRASHVTERCYARNILPGHTPDPSCRVS
jgi:hypothetical protein